MQIYSYYNKEIKKNVLSKNLHTLIFGCAYNLKIKKGVLPESLHTLTLGYSYNQKIKEGVLPKFLHTLKLGYFFQKDIVIPESVKEIELYSHNNLINNLPCNIETVYIKFDYDIETDRIVDNLPVTLKKIVIQEYSFMEYIKKIPFDCEVEVRNFN